MIKNPNFTFGQNQFTQSKRRSNSSQTVRSLKNKKTIKINAKKLPENFFHSSFTKAKKSTPQVNINSNRIQQAYTVKMVKIQKSANSTIDSTKLELPEKKLQKSFSIKTKKVKSNRFRTRSIEEINTQQNCIFSENTNFSKYQSLDLRLFEDKSSELTCMPKQDQNMIWEKLNAQLININRNLNKQLNGKQQAKKSLISDFRQQYCAKSKVNFISAYRKKLQFVLPSFRHNNIKSSEENNFCL